jgi:hypothetical protein
MSTNKSEISVFVCIVSQKVEITINQHRGKTSAHASTLPVIVLRT